MEAIPKSVATPLDALQAVLITARGLLSDFVSDPLLRRVLRAFEMFPRADREPILSILERDASWTRIAEASAVVTGIAVRPNPHASLYVHVLDAATGQPAATAPSERDANVMRLGIERIVRVLPLFFQEGVYAQWYPAAREVARTADPEARTAIARVAREVLALVADPEAGEA